MWVLGGKNIDKEEYEIIVGDGLELVAGGDNGDRDSDELGKG